MPTVNTGIQYINIDEFTNNVVINENNEYYPVTGDGIFDDLMETATKHLLAQYKANRIRGENFATTYAHIYEVTLQAALTAWLQKPEQAAKVELINAQTEHTKEQTALVTEQAALAHAQTLHEEAKKLNTEQDTILKQQQAAYIKNQADAAEKDKDLKTAQTNSENMKTNLYKRQIEGYDENYKEKILKILLDSFTVVFSVASEGFKGGLPKILTVSGINDLSDIITNDLNIPMTDDNVSDVTNTSNKTTSIGSNAGNNHHNTTIPKSYSQNGWDAEGGSTYHS